METSHRERRERRLAEHTWGRRADGWCAGALLAAGTTDCSHDYLTIFSRFGRVVNCVVSVCPSAWNNLDPTGQIFLKFDVRVFFENLWTKIQVSLIYDDIWIFVIKRRGILPRMRTFPKQKSQRKWHTFYLASSRKSCRLWDNVAKYGRAGEAADDSIMRRMRLTCWMTRLGARLYVHCLSCVTWAGIGWHWAEVQSAGV